MAASTGFAMALRGIAFAFGLASATGALAQSGAEFPFSGLKQDPSLPVEIAADELAVSQADGTAVFSGNVLIGQGEMRLSADKVLVVYAKGENDQPGKIARLEASGNVILVNGGERAEAETAVYSIDAGEAVLTGNVILTQGQSAISGEKLVINLKTGTGKMEGRVRTILSQGGTP